MRTYRSFLHPGTVVVRSASLIGSKAVQEISISLLFVWLARRDPSGYGLIILGLSIVMLLRSLQSLGLDQFTLRELSSSHDQKGQLLRQMAKIKIFIAAVIILLFLAFAFLKQWPSQHIAVVSVLLVGQCFEGVADTFFNMLRAEGKSINESICRTGPNLISTFYGAWCLFFHLDILLFALLFLMGGGMKLLLAIYSSRKLCDFSLFNGEVFSFGKTGIQALVLISCISFFGTFYNEIQIFWLKQYHTLVDVAQYRVALDVTTFVCGAFAHLIVGAVLFPQLVNCFASGEYEQFAESVRSYLKKIVTLGSGLAFFLSIFGGLLVYFIYGDQYLSAESLIPLFGAAAFFSFINNFIIYVLMAMREEKKLFLVLFVPVSISIFLGPLLVADIGPMGAATSLLLSRGVLSIFLVIILQKKINFFKLQDYKGFGLGWMMALAVFSLLLPINSLLSGCLALLTYILSVWLEQIRSDKREKSLLP